MPSQHLEVQLKKIAASLGILQGFTYAILALICIILYNQDPPNMVIDDYMDTVNYYIYVIFLGPTNRIFDGQIFTPTVFDGFVWIYFILHILWIALSADILIRKTLARRMNNLRYWSRLTFAISFWDLLTVILLGVDYGKCLSCNDTYYGFCNEKILKQEGCVNGIIPVLVIAARGFVLWIINVVFAAILYRMSAVSQPIFIPQPISYQNQQPGAQPYLYHPEPSSGQAPNTYGQPQHSIHFPQLGITSPSRTPQPRNTQPVYQQQAPISRAMVPPINSHQYPFGAPRADY